MKTSLNILRAPKPFRWLAAGAALCILLLCLIGGSFSIWLMKNMLAGNEARHFTDHLRGEFRDRISPEDLQPVFSPRAVSALDVLFHGSMLARTEKLKRLRLWSTEGRLLWDSHPGAEEVAPPAEALGEAHREGVAFRLDPPNTFLSAFQPAPSPLYLVSRAPIAGPDAESAGHSVGFVLETVSEPLVLKTELADYETHVWLVSGFLGLLGTSFILWGLAVLGRLHVTVTRQAAQGLLTSKITKVLSADLDPDRLFRDILREIRHAIPCDRIVIAGVDPATKEHRIWHIEHTLPVPTLSAEEERETGEWYLRNVYSPMRPVNFPDLERVDTSWSRRLLKAGLKSSFVLPIRQDEGKGFYIHLGLAWTRKGGGDAEGAELLSSLAGHLGSAVRNAALFRMAETRASRLATLNILSQKITQNVDLRETLDAIVNAAAELLGADISRAFLLEEDTGILIPHAHAGRIPPPSSPPGTLRAGKGVIGRVVASGKPMILEDVQQAAEWQLEDWVRDHGLHAYIAYPLRLGEKSFGAIYCLSSRSGIFTQEDLGLLGSFSFQAAIAIEKARLFAETRQRALRLELAGQITKALASTLRPSELFRTMIREIRRAVPCERCVIGSFSRDTRHIHAWHFESDIDPPFRADPFDEEGVWWDRDVYEMKRVVNQPDISVIPHARARQMAEAGIKSIIAMPILQDGECAAHILLSSTRPANFTHDHERLLQSLSDLFGMAIRNAMLYQASEEKTSRLEITGEIAKALGSSLEPEQLFQTIVREIRKVIPCERCVIARLDLAGATYQYFHIESDIEVPERTAEADRISTRWFHREVYEAKQPKLVPDLSKCLDDDTMKPWSERLVRTGLRSFLAIPILQTGNSIAHVAISSVRANAFSGAQISLLTSIAQHIGSAIRNAMLYQASEEKTSRLEITGEIAKALGSSLEPEETFRTITREIRRAVPCERCIIASVEARGPFPSYWHTDSDIDLPPPTPGEADALRAILVEKLYERKEPYYIPDITAEEGLQDRFVQLGFRSQLFIPVLDGSVCIAHIALTSFQKNAFSPAQHELLASIAAYVGPAIRNAKLYRTAGERAARLSVLNELNRKISENLDLGEALNSITQAVATLLHADYARLFMAEPETKELVLQAAVGAIPWPPGLRAVIPPQSSLAGWVLENEKPVLISDLAADSRWEPMPWEWIPAGSVRSAIAYPLTQSGRPAGVILALAQAAGAFAEEDLALLGGLASQASIAVEKAVHFSAARERAVRLSVLNQLNQKIIATHSLDDILNALLQAAAELLKGEHTHIFLYDEAEDRLKLRATYGRPPTLDGQILTLRPGEGIGGRVFATGLPVNMRDVNEEPNWLTADWSRETGIRSCISQPLSQRGRNIGIINCFSVKPGFFSEEDVNLLGALASQTAIAIEKTDLLRQAQERAARLELAGEIARALSSSLEPEHVFRVIVSEIRKAIPCERCVIARLDPGTNAYLYLHVESDVSVEPAPEGGATRGTWFHREVYQTLRPKFVPDLSQMHDEAMTPWSDRLVSAGLRSLLIVPILQDGRCIAHISLTSTRANAFSREQIDLLTSIAQHIGSAIRNTSLYRTAEQRASRLLVLNRLNRHITENLALDETLGSIVHASYDLLGADLARLYLVDESSNRVIQRAAYGNVPMDRNMRQSFRTGEGITGSVVETGEALLVPDILNDPRWLSTDWARANGLHSFIVQPLRQGARIIGVLNCVSRKIGLFSKPDLELLGALASQAAIAVQNARLHDEEKRSREFLNSVVGDTSDPITITNLDRTILLWNSGAEALYGYTEPEALGRKVDIIIPEEDMARNKTITARVIAEKLPYTYETQRLRKDGAPIPVSITISPVQDERGEVVALAGIHKDLSEWKRAERALQEAKEEAEAANRAKSVFLSNLNHELRSPLNVITGLSDILRLEARDGETAQVAQKVREAGEHMLSLIEDLLDLDRISTGKLSLQLRDAPVDSLVRSAVEGRIPQLPCGFTLVSDLRSEDYAVRCDLTRFHQILGNLLDNAVKYSPSGGTITVRTERRGEEAWISVQDEGIGVGPEEARIIFERFAQLESGGAHRGGGLGIGLHLVKQLLGLQGGRIWVEGEKGSGSIFTFSLPLCIPAPPAGGGENGEAGPPAAEADEPWEGASVLVVEGQTPFHGYLKVLMRNAARLLTARAEEGLELARKERPDLILLDVEAPHGEGLRLLQRLKSLPETRGIPAVAVASEAAGAGSGNGWDLADGFLARPIDPVAFRLEMGRVFAGRKKAESAPHTLRAPAG
ncbi:MAG: GAF domain-containing protein [Candidatus Tectomicrobia bacterium]|uniref:histidine kinase n=1 Tax=Tectimicrobiota bacterium TaxID=2528274 RepID=A0A932HZA6_UNCTE|nr:GAF domain-containing protein [Candidatus Tectomicrobia bacterium]